MNIIMLVIIGTAAGFVATRMMKLETSVPMTIFIGVIGAVAGGFILNALLTVMGLMAGLAGAILGSLLLIWLWQKYGPGS